MERNFRSTFRKVSAEPLDSVYVAGTRVAERLLADEQEARGWLVIDPQCLTGERTYDVANAFYNPEGFLSQAEATETIERRCTIYSKRLKLDRQRILEFAFAYGCLSAA